MPAQHRDTGIHAEALIRIGAFAAMISPLVWLAFQVILLYQGRGGALGADPGKYIVHYTGTSAVLLLLATLAITPLSKLLASTMLVRLRRMVGLFVFAYASMHLLAYVTFLLEFDFGAIAGEIIKRPYITVGACAFLLLLPLAITSNRFFMRRLKQRWKRLHRLIYPAAILVILHVFWLTKSEYLEPLVYGALLLVLLGIRVFWWLQGRGFPYSIRRREAFSK